MQRRPAINMVWIEAWEHQILDENWEIDYITINKWKWLADWVGMTSQSHIMRPNYVDWIPISYSGSWIVNHKQSFTFLIFLKPVWPVSFSCVSHWWSHCYNDVIVVLWRCRVNGHLYPWPRIHVRLRWGIWATYTGSKKYNYESLYSIWYHAQGYFPKMPFGYSF